MTTYRKRPIAVEAHRWYKNGDHPNDNVPREVEDQFTGGTYTKVEGDLVRYYRHPDIPGTLPCNKCGHIMHDHGWLDDRDGGNMVCPGNWIVYDGDSYYPVAPKLFDRYFEPVVAQQ